MPGKRKLPKTLVDINNGTHKRNAKIMRKVFELKYEEAENEE
jgi:hypothetical protein